MTYHEQRGVHGYPNPCVVCGVRPFERCVIPRTGRKTDTHMARVRGEWPTPSNRSETPPVEMSTGASEN